MPRQVAALVRHGVYDQPRGVPSAHLPHPLTDEGQVLARAAGDELQAMAAEARLSIDPVVDASQLLRAWQTARGLATRLEELGAGPFTVTVELSEASPIELYIFSSNGAKVDRRALSGQLRYEEEYDLALASGVYVCVLQTPVERKAISFIVVSL